MIVNSGEIRVQQKGLFVAAKTREETARVAWKHKFFSA